MDTEPFNFLGFFAVVNCGSLPHLKNKMFLISCTLLLPPASEGWREVIFSLCVSVHTSTGGGGRVGTPPIQVRSQDRGGRAGVGTPPSRSDPRRGVGTPPSRSDHYKMITRWGGYPPFHPGQIPGWGGRGQGRGYPLLEQHSVCLLRSWRCASCVHAGGLSCLEYVCVRLLPQGWRPVWRILVHSGSIG